MNQQEWIALFESVNGRKPTPDELVAAAKAGVIPTPKHGKSKAKEEVKQKTSVAQTERPVFSRPAPERDEFGRKISSSKPSQAERPKPTQTQSTKEAEPKPKPVSSASSTGQTVRRASFGGVHQAPQASVTSASQQVAEPERQVNQEPEATTSGRQTQRGFNQTNQSSVQPVQKQKAKWPKVLATLVALFFLALAGAGGYAWWRNDSGNIEGTWELTDWHYYNQKSGKWIDALNQYEKNDYSYTDFVTVDGQKHFQEDSFYFSNDYKSYPNVSLASYLDNIYQVDQWNKEIIIAPSESNYKTQVTKILKQDLKGYYKNNKGTNVNKDISSIIAGYSYSRMYSVQDDELTITTKDKSGRTISKAVYKRLSATKAKDMKKNFKRMQAKFEKNYHIK